jgi:phenylacetate-CoA ligase
MSRLTDGDEVERLSWPLERLWEARDARLRALVRHAKERSPWHARRLAAVDPERVSGESLGELPLMGKQDLMGAWDEISTDRRLRLAVARDALASAPDDEPRFVLDGYLVMQTSGTSGPPTVLAWDVPGWIDMAAAVLRPGMWLQRQASRGARIEPPSTPFVQATIGSTHATSMSRQLALFLRNPMVVNHEIPARTPLPQMVERLNALSPWGLFGYASALAMLAGEAMAGRLRIRPALVGASSEPLLEPMEDLLRDAFGVEPSNTYAVTEIGGLAARSVPGGAGLRLIEDIAVYEVDDTGSLVVTNVLNTALPLIRYRLGDRVRIDADPDGGPWSGRRLVIDDSSGATFAYAGGASVEAAALVEAMARHPDVVDYAVEQTAGGLAATLWAPRHPLGEAEAGAIRRDLTRALALAGLRDPQVATRVVADPGALPQTPAGKRRRFTPH